MNNKGMAISSILYIILILFLALLFGILGLISTGKSTFDSLKDKTNNNINKNIPEVLVTVNENDQTKMDIKITSRQYIDKYSLTTTDNPNEYETLEYPKGEFIILEDISNGIHYLYLKDIHDTMYEYQINVNEETSFTVTFIKKEG